MFKFEQCTHQWYTRWRESTKGWRMVFLGSYFKLDSLTHWFLSIQTIGQSLRLKWFLVYSLVIVCFLLRKQCVLKWCNCLSGLSNTQVSVIVQISGMNRKHCFILIRDKGQAQAYRTFTDSQNLVSVFSCRSLLASCWNQGADIMAPEWHYCLEISGSNLNNATGGQESSIYPSIHPLSTVLTC